MNIAKRMLGIATAAILCVTDICFSGGVSLYKYNMRGEMIMSADFNTEILMKGTKK